MQAMGMSVTQLPGGEIVPALERGVIDAFEFNNPTSDSRFGAQDVATHYMMGSYHQAAETFEIIFNKDVYDGLDPDLQAIIEYATEAANTANYGNAMDIYSRDFQTLIDGGTIVKRVPDEVLEAQLVAWDEVIENLNSGGVLRKGDRQPEGIRGAGRLLSPYQPGRLQARLRPLLPWQARLLSRTRKQ
jgi:TRAP-type mannitol/chloroaromatic compound transport system substrate-binding protein